MKFFFKIKKKKITEDKHSSKFKNIINGKVKNSKLNAQKIKLLSKIVIIQIKKYK